MTSKMNAITYAFRRPRFPMICDLNGYLVAAESPTALQRCLAGVDLTTERKGRLVDGTGESWMLLPEKMIMAPAFPMGKWRKIEIIRLFNESRNAKESGRRYPERGAKKGGQDCFWLFSANVPCQSYPTCLSPNWCRASNATQALKILECSRVGSIGVFLFRTVRADAARLGAIAA